MSDSGVTVPRLVDDGYNFPTSHWMCWACVRPFVVLGSHGNERCQCGAQAEYLGGLLLAKREDADAATTDG